MSTTKIRSVGDFLACLDTVSKLLSLNLSVIPSGGGDKHKSPVVEWTEFQKRLPTQDELTKWYKELSPSLWGIVTGAISGIVVFDADSPETVELFHKAGLKPHVVTRRGEHFYFKHPGHLLKNQVGIIPHIDLRADGGFVNCMGDNDNASYEMLIIPTNDTLYDLTQLPIEVKQALLAIGDKRQATPTREAGNKIKKGERDRWLASRAGGYHEKGDDEETVFQKLKIDYELNCEHEPEPKTDADFRRIAHSVNKYANKTKKDTEGEVKGVSFAIVGDCIYEQIYTNEQSAFAEYNMSTGEFKTVTHIMQGETKIIPQQGEELTLVAIKLPTGVAEYGDTLSLLREIEAHIFRYLDVSDAFRKFAAYYILLSWLYDKFSTLPYIRAIGDTGCGKSRLLDVIGLLCYKPTLVSGCITPAPIYRMLKRWNGTMILDEADLQNSNEYSEVVKILNCGFERGRPVIRATKDNPDKLQFLPTFGPKVFATRRRFKDPALEARCLTEIMQETTRDDIPAILTSSFYKEQEALRNKLLLFRLRNYAMINPEETVTLDFHGIEPRLKQISAGFASLFAGQPEVLSDYRAFIKHHQRELIEQRAATQIGQVIEQLFALTESVTNVTNVTNVTGEELIPISSKDIAEPLNMTPQAVGQILKTLGLHTKVHKVEGASKRCIVYDSVKLDTLKRRYIPSEDDQVTLVTTVTTVTGLNGDNSEPIETKPEGER